MNIVIVHGVKSLPLGFMHLDFKSNLDKALVLVAEQSVDAVAITGGITRRNVLSEAETGKIYLLKNNPSIKALVEAESLTTRENVIEVKRLVERADMNIEKMWVVTSWYHIPRTLHLYSLYWNDACDNIIPVRTWGYSLSRLLSEPIRYFAIWLDLNEHSMFLRFCKRFFRNSQN